MDSAANLPEILDNFTFLDDWEDRYRYLIELGRTLPPLPECFKTEAYRVRGCASQVWLRTEARTDDSGERKLYFQGDSDAHIVRGLVALVLAIFSGQTPAAISGRDARAIFEQLGLQAHLTPQRANGLKAMVDRIQAEAQAAIA